MELTSEQEAEARNGLDQAAAIVAAMGWYDTGPREQNLHLAREAFNRIGLPPDRWDVAAVEWAKTLVEEALQNHGITPRATDIIRGLERGLAF